MSASDAETEGLRALVGAIVAAQGRGAVKSLTPNEKRMIEKESTALARKRIDSLFRAVIRSLTYFKLEPKYRRLARPRPLGQAQLQQLAQVLANILNGYEEPPRKAGRRQHDHRLIVIDFLLRKQAAPRAALKKLHADIAVDWGTTDANVKKLIAENRRPAGALLEKIGVEKANRTVQAARRQLQRYRNST
ncbi:MAG TPA: hypothetical protein VGG63_16370 [Steroidobacteraceae bacterium]